MSFAVFVLPGPWVISFHLKAMFLLIFSFEVISGTLEVIRRSTILFFTIFVLPGFLAFN